jgi:hypothetical protein
MIVLLTGSGAVASHHDVGMTDRDRNDNRWSFRLGFGPFAPTRADDANYVAYMRLRTAPPEGCRFAEDYGIPRLECCRRGPTRFAVIGRLVREIRTDYGIVGTDSLGIAKLWEWVPRDRDWCESIAGQLLLMGTVRAEQLGIGVEDVVALVRDAMAPALKRRHDASARPTGSHAAGTSASGAVAAAPDAGTASSIHEPGSRSGTNPAPE